MIRDINKAIKLVEEQLIKINQVDNAMSTIYNTFAIKNVDEKEQAFGEYMSLLKQRDELLVPIIEVQEYLGQVIGNLDKVKHKFYDRYTIKRKIKDMKNQIHNAVEFQEDETVVAVPEVKVEETKKK
jgi:hypothetical protein